MKWRVFGLPRLVAAFYLAVVIAAGTCAADWPFVVREKTTNTIELPSGSTEIWFSANPTGSITVPLRSNEGSRFEFVLPPERNIPMRLLGIMACRIKVNGRWQTIHETIAEPAEVQITNEFAHSKLIHWAGWFGSIGVLNEPVKRFPLGKLPEEKYDCEVVANRLGSQLDPVLRVVDSHGREVAYCDDDPFAARDSRISFKPSRKQEYFLEIRDVAYGSGSDYFFYLRGRSRDTKTDAIGMLPWIGSAGRFPEPPGPNNILENAEYILIPYRAFERFGDGKNGSWFSFNAEVGQTLIIRVQTRTVREPCDAQVSLFDPDGKSIGASVGAGADPASITNRFESGGLHRIRVLQISGPGEIMGYQLLIEKPTPGVTLTTDVERVDFSKEGEAKIKIACKRYEYDGPVKLEVDGLPEGVSLTDSVIEKGKNEGELKLKREKEVDGFQVRITGVIENKETKGTKEGFPVSTMPALRKLYPLQMFPCAAMDGWIAVNPPP